MDAITASNTQTMSHCRWLVNIQKCPWPTVPVMTGTAAAGVADSEQPYTGR